ncbi:MAG: hypothetical protein Roseis2KO_17540 [Roseivirga sp.]
MAEQENKQEGKMKLKEYFAFGEVLGYFFRKKDPSRPKNFNLKVMHGINKISIIMFLIALTVMIARAIMR